MNPVHQVATVSVDELGTIRIESIEAPPRLRMSKEFRLVQPINKPSEQLLADWEICISWISKEKQQVK